VYQALACGTPVLSLPGHLETAVTAIALVQAGLGATLAASAVAADARLLRRAVESLLADDALRARVSAAAATIDDAAALRAAVDAAESLAR
jgi:UDP:flavonoid glycosyltransferase YjiC (YdhE family)